MKTLRLHDPDSWRDPSSTPGSVLIFDDVQYHPMSKEIEQLRDMALETRRHHTDSDGEGIVVLCVSHGIQLWRQTLCPHRECSHVILYPRSSKAEVRKYLKNKLSMDSKKADELIGGSLERGRYLGVHTSYPMCAYDTSKLTLL